MQAFLRSSAVPVSLPFSRPKCQKTTSIFSSGASSPAVHICPIGWHLGVFPFIFSTEVLVSVEIRGQLKTEMFYWWKDKITDIFFLLSSWRMCKVLIIMDGVCHVVRLPLPEITFLLHIQLFKVQFSSSRGCRPLGLYAAYLAFATNTPWHILLIFSCALTIYIYTHTQEEQKYLVFAQRWMWI